MEVLDCGCGTMELGGVDAEGRSVFGVWTRLCPDCRRHMEIGKAVEKALETFDPHKWCDGCGCCADQALDETDEWKAIEQAIKR